MQNNKRDSKGRFLPGNISPMKGRKGVHNSPGTEFKQGISNNRLKKNPMWKGGIRNDSSGYVSIKTPDHPHADRYGYVKEHRLVMEKHLGRYLEKQEVVHHINEDRTDNKIENLQLMESLSEHMTLHNKQVRDTNGS